MAGYMLRRLIAYVSQGSKKSLITIIQEDTKGERVLSNTKLPNRTIPYSCLA